MALFGHSHQYLVTKVRISGYNDASCDSHKLFDHRRIAEENDYEKHMNQYNVICLDITVFTSAAKDSMRSFREIPSMIKEALWKDLCESGFAHEEGDSLNDFLLRCVPSGGKPFIFIIDEWDAVIREAGEDAVAQEAYLNLLRGWFKNNNFTSKAVATAYMTGILPIKKDGSQSAISDFKEFSVIKPR